MTARTMQWALNELSKNRKVAIASVVSTSGSVPGKEGARLALTSTEVNGTVGGAGLEMKVIKKFLIIGKMKVKNPQKMKLMMQ